MYRRVRPLTLTLSPEYGGEGIKAQDAGEGIKGEYGGEGKTGGCDGEV